MNKTLLVILAHPDDESFGPGGTLGKYAHNGVAVHYLCGTRGESGTVDADKLQGYNSVAELRTSELQCAAQELKLAGVHFLGYRDSGMIGSDDNSHTDSLHAAPLDEVAARIAQFINDLKPQTIITHDQFGGYGHPDHIKLHQATLRAYESLYGIRIDLSHWNSDRNSRVVTAHDTSLVQIKPAASDTPRLYFPVFPKNLARWGVRLMPLLRQDPRKFGRNKDIDLVQIASWDVPITATVDTREYVAVKQRASACHASQQMGGGQSNLITRILFRRTQGNESFSRVYPPVSAGARKETELI